MKYTYTPSKLLPGEGELLREHGFTRWISPDWFQVTCEYLRNIGLLPIYAEYSPDKQRRCICWHPPEGCYFEVRTGRILENFEELDRRCTERGWPLLTLHVSESGAHSAVWVSANYYETAKTVLARYGIAPASRTLLA